MAIYIPIHKLAEDDRSVTYAYGSLRPRSATGPGDHQNATSSKPGYDFGELSIDKASGTTSLVVPAPGDAKAQLYSRAARKLYLHWRDGEFPDRTCWAS